MESILIDNADTVGKKKRLKVSLNFIEDGKSKPKKSTKSKQLILNSKRSGKKNIKNKSR